MKILLLFPELFSSEGGIPRILRLYLKAVCELAEPDGEVRLVVLNDKTIDSTDLRSFASDRLTDWEACRRSKAHFIRAALQFSRNVDLVICGHIGQLPVAWLAQLRYRKLHYILIAHGLEVWRPFSWLERRSLRQAHRLWCVSDFTRRELLKNSGLRAEHALVLSNGLDPTFHAAGNENAPTAGPVILTVSRLSWSDNYKGIDHLIAAMPEIRRKVPLATLRIVGRGDDLPRLQILSDERGLQGIVHFVGYLDDADLEYEFSRCGVFALPSQREGFGLVYIEAMAHGKPCVGANAGGTPEVITPETGLLCPYGDIPALAQACTEALQKPWDASAIQARAEVFSYPSFRDRLNGLLASYEKRSA